MEKRLQRGTCVPSPHNRRSGTTDRRKAARGGRRVADFGRAGAFTVLCLLLHASTAAAQVKFGFDADSARVARRNGLAVSYGSLWAGAWNQKWGWGGVQTQLRTAKSAGVTPLVQWWYWGDDISPSCVENGCIDRYHGVRKNRATWTKMSNQLADLIVNTVGSNAIVVIEAEFNKSGIENYERFDGYLAEQVKIFKARNLKVAIEFGNWGRPRWKSFDRAVARADYLGAMALQSSRRDASTYRSGADSLLSQARFYQSTFRKPVFVTDFAFSSYPEPAYETLQDLVIIDIFKRMAEFRRAGVRGMVWRMLADDPNFDTNNYHGIAERHWGLIRANGSRKAAFTSFSRGMKAELALASR
jgi:hypothetical protein